MMILKPKEKGLKVKSVGMTGIVDPTTKKTLIDVTRLPEGHLSCPLCNKVKFEPWFYPESNKVEVGCTHCGWQASFLFPLDVSLSAFKNRGRVYCKRHEHKSFIIIHNSGWLSFGCEQCSNQIDIYVWKTTSLIV